MIRNNAGNGERERLRFLYCQARKKAGLPNGTDAEIESAIDRALERRAKENREHARPVDERPTSPPVQMSLVDCDDATKRTRANAAADAIPKHASRRERVARWIAQRGEYGATRDEIEAADLGLGIQSVCPIVNELQKQGLIIPTGRTRPTRRGKSAVVMVARSHANDGGNRG